MLPLLRCCGLRLLLLVLCCRLLLLLHLVLLICPLLPFFRLCRCRCCLCHCAPSFLPRRLAFLLLRPCWRRCRWLLKCGRLLKCCKLLSFGGWLNMLLCLRGRLLLRALLRRGLPSWRRRLLGWRLLLPLRCLLLRWLLPLTRPDYSRLLRCWLPLSLLLLSQRLLCWLLLCHTWLL